MLVPEQQEFAPDWFSKPVDSLLGLMRRRDIPIEAVASKLDGGMETIRGLLRGTRAIDHALAKSISVTVGGSPIFWMKRQANYERALELAVQRALDEFEEWLSVVPTPGPKPIGRLSEAKILVELRKRLEFYGVNNLRTWHARYGQIRQATRFRTSHAFASREGCTSLWLRQGEIEAALTTTRRWDPHRLRASLGDILKLSKIRRLDRFLPKLWALGADAGVAIVVIRAPQGCKASGACRLVAPDKAMVQLSCRHLSDDHFWFTLLHELGHLLLHNAEPFIDAEDVGSDDEREREANDFASSCIIPAERWDEFANLDYSNNSVIRFSVALGVAPGLIVGQLQHHGLIPRNQLNFLKRRWSWADVDAAIN